METTFDFLSVTELSGDEVSQEQVDRICHRYFWAGQFCIGKDVVEAACGTGQGLGYLKTKANSLSAGDFSQSVLSIAMRHYGNRVELKRFDAQDLPYADKSKDVIILFEAIYYLPSAEKFVAECKRVLRPGGKVLIATANKDLYDFNPSPHSFKYFGTVEFQKLFNEYGFSVNCYGNTPVDLVSLKQRILRPVKKLAVSFNLVPKSMAYKKILKRFVFGKLVEMPAEIKEGMSEYLSPTCLDISLPDRSHKVIYCEATLKSNS